MSDKLTTESPTHALAIIPDDLQRDAGRGTEDIGPDDVRPPRILLCQSGSPYRKPDDTKQIPGLNELDIFNDLTGDIYGRGPLKFVVVKAFPPRHIQFAPMDQGGGVIDFNVPPSDPRTQFTTNEEGDRVKPIATKFYDYLVWLPDHQELAVLSMKSTQIPVAIQLNSRMKSPLKGEIIHPSLKGQIVYDPPAWARTFSLTTVMERDASYAWGNYNLKPEGVTPVEIRQICRTLADTYAKKNIIIERDQHDDATSFDPATMDGGAMNRGIVNTGAMDTETEM